MNMKHFIGVSLLICCCIIFLSCQASAPVSSSSSKANKDTSPVLAHVGDRTITENQVELMKKRMARFGKKSKEQIADELVNKKLLFLGALEENFDDDPNVQNQYETMLGKMYLMKKVASLGKSDQELEKYYEDHKEDFILPKKASISHILLLTKEKAQKVRDDIEQGKLSFQDAAKKFSEDKTTSMKGGQIGIVTQGNFQSAMGNHPAINRAVFTSKKGDVLGPFSTEKGYELIHVDEFKEIQYQPFNRARNDIIGLLTVSDQEIEKYYQENKEKRFKQKAFVKARHIQVKTKKEAEAVLARLKKDEPFNKLVKEVSLDKQSFNKNGDLGLIYTDGYVQRIGKDKNFIDALFQLNKGDIGPILKTAVGYHVVQVYEKSPGRYNNLEKVKKRIVSILVGQKRIEHRKTLLKDLETKFKVKKLYKKSDPKEKS